MLVLVSKVGAGIEALGKFVFPISGAPNTNEARCICKLHEEASGIVVQRGCMAALGIRSQLKLISVGVNLALPASPSNYH